MRRFGFTLIEVNLALLMVTVGVLSLVALFSFGYRENQQSNEDVQAAAVAEAALNTMIAALSSTNMTWDAWKSIGIQPAEGWGFYAGDGTNNGWSEMEADWDARPPNNTTSTALGIVNGIVSKAGGGGGLSQSDLHGLQLAVVVVPSSDRRICSVSVRAGRRLSTLLYQALYYSEVYFQGLRE